MMMFRSSLLLAFLMTGPVKAITPVELGPVCVAAGPIDVFAPMG